MASLECAVLLCLASMALATTTTWPPPPKWQEKVKMGTLSTATLLNCTLYTTISCTDVRSVTGGEAELKLLKKYI